MEVHKQVQRRASQACSAVGTVAQTAEQVSERSSCSADECAGPSLAHCDCSQPKVLLLDPKPRVVGVVKNKKPQSRHPAPGGTHCRRRTQGGGAGHASHHLHGCFLDQWLPHPQHWPWREPAAPASQLVHRLMDGQTGSREASGRAGGRAGGWEDQRTE